MIRADLLKLGFLWFAICLVVLLLPKSVNILVKRFKAFQTYGKIVTQLTIIAMVLAGLTFSFGVLGFNEAFVSSLTFSAIFALGASLAIRQLITNVIAGIELAVSKDFCVGHRVEVAGKQGEVVGMGLSKTKLNTGKEVVIIPNSRITGVYGWTIMGKTITDETKKLKEEAYSTPYQTMAQERYI